ncbi:MAG: helix-turn-helix domain-containing protein [Pseudobdellovibrio sp.]|nr:helix-turn-helix domain-containing protein [Pseudobdellovibrio sp.]
MDHTEKAGISEPVIVKNVSDLGMIIRDERKRKNLSQAELAARAGVSRRLIYQLENGTKDSFPIGKVLQVIRRLNLELRASKKRSD